MTEREQQLTGGNATAAVVRVGGTVRKPWTRASDDVHSFVGHLRSRGIPAPAHAGPDAHGRQIIDYVPGTMADAGAPLDLPTLTAVGGAVRAIHDASRGYPLHGAWSALLPATAPDLVCHGDLTPWNLVLTADGPVFIDWDGAAPSTALWDLAYSAQAFAGIEAGRDPGEAARRLAAFVDGYGADAALRAALPDLLPARAAAMHDMLAAAHRDGTAPWGAMFVGGHGAHWNGVAAYARAHRDTWADALSPP